jgi:hypothetical protein
MDEENKAEFKWFEEIQDKLCKACLAAGFDQQTAEQFGFCVAQGIRDVPALLRLLNESDQHSTDEIMHAVHMVLANRASLSEAAQLVGLPPTPSR